MENKFDIFVPQKPNPEVVVDNRLTTVQSPHVFTYGTPTNKWDLQVTEGSINGQLLELQQKIQSSEFIRLPRIKAQCGGGLPVHSTSTYGITSTERSGSSRSVSRSRSSLSSRYIPEESSNQEPTTTEYIRDIVSQVGEVDESEK